MTDESEVEGEEISYILRHPLSWRSQSMYLTAGKYFGGN